ncbi:MAG TPA: hypothetical protein VIV82_02160 [Verrucomicrobiae bacterium]
MPEEDGQTQNKALTTQRAANKLGHEHRLIAPIFERDITLYRLKGGRLEEFVRLRTRYGCKLGTTPFLISLRYSERAGRSGMGL